MALVVASNVLPGDNTGLRAFLAALTLGAVALTGVAVNVLLDARGKTASAAIKQVETAVMHPLH